MQKVNRKKQKICEGKRVCALMSVSRTCLMSRKKFFHRWEFVSIGENVT